MRAGRARIGRAGERVDVAQEEAQVDVLGAERVEFSAVGTGSYARTYERFDRQPPIAADGNVGQPGLAAVQIDGERLRVEAVAGETEAQLGHAGDRAGVADARASLRDDVHLDAEHGLPAPGREQRTHQEKKIIFFLRQAHQWGHFASMLAVVGVWLLSQM